MLKTSSPVLRILSEDFVQRIIDEAIEVLERVGVLIENQEALDLLGEHGARVDHKKVRFKRELVEGALKTAPSSITLYDRDGKPALELKGRNTHFNPGSAALMILDSHTGKLRRPVTEDLIKFAKLTAAMENIPAQSTALVPSDVPVSISDWYRLYLCLLNCPKPIITGSFSGDGFAVMKDMLVAVRGSLKALIHKPLAIFDCCPSPPLKWSHLTCQTLIDCARAGMPAELVSMPLAGATGPATLAGSLVQLTAENLSGILIGQLASPGAPIIFGASPAIFDMRKGTTPMGALETMLMDLAANQIGKYLGLPTHAYMGLSDSKLVDYQAGLESGTGAVLAALAGINVVSGPGMLNFENCQSLEKLVIDNEICGMALRVAKGIEARGEKLGEDLFGDIYDGEYFLTSANTLRWFREEQYFPGEVIDRGNTDEWLKAGGKDTWGRAEERVREILATKEPKPLSREIEVELRDIVAREGKIHGFKDLLCCARTSIHRGIRVRTR